MMCMVVLAPQLGYRSETAAELLCRALSVEHEGNTSRGRTKS